MLRRADNNRLQRTVIRRHGGGASAPLHYALAPRVTRQRAAAEPERLGDTRIGAYSLWNSRELHKHVCSFS